MTRFLKCTHNKDVQVFLYLKVLPITQGSEWIEWKYWIKLQLSEIDTKCVLIILNEVSSVDNFDSPSVLKNTKGKWKWTVRIQTCDQGVCWSAEHWAMVQSSSWRRKNVGLQTRMCTVTAWCKGWEQTEGPSQLFEDRFNTSANLIWNWNLPDRFLSPTNEMTIFAYETLLRLNTWVCEKWMQCTAKQQFCAQIQRQLKQRERVEAAEVFAMIFAFFQTVSYRLC